MQKNEIGKHPNQLLFSTEGSADAMLAFNFIADLTNADALKEVATRTKHIDGIIHCAGVGCFREFTDTNPNVLAQLTEVNLLAPMILTTHLLLSLLEKPQAVVVNIGSVFGLIGHPGYAAYCATKFGLYGFSQALSRELADSSVRVVYVAPRAVTTAFNSTATNEMNKTLGNLSALKAAKRAKKNFEQVIAHAPLTLQGSAYVSLGVLYYSVPRWPLAFGNRNKALTNLLLGLDISPEGMDANFFLGEYWRKQKNYDKAIGYLEKASSAPARLKRPKADAGRRQEIHKMLVEMTK